jgi:hypothetical protein
LLKCPNNLSSFKDSFKVCIIRIKQFNLKYAYCCRRQHTILNMKYCVYVCPVSLAELCIAERQLDFICNVRMFGWSDLWRILTSQKFYSKNNILQIAIWLSEYPGWTSRTPPWTMTICMPRSRCKFLYVWLFIEIFFKVRYTFDHK